MKCKYCGKNIVEGAKFCVYCGKPVEGESNIPIVEESKEEIIPEPTEVNIAPENDIKIDEAPIESNVEVNVEPTPIELPKEEPEPIVEPAPVQPEVAPQPTIENKTEVVVKKNNPILLLIIILLLIGILGVGGFYVYKNYIEKDNKNTGNTEPTETTDVVEDNINENNYNLEEINKKINEYDDFLIKIVYDTKGKNILSNIEFKLAFVDYMVPTKKTYESGVSQEFVYVTYEEYKEQYEKLYGDSSKMDEEISSNSSVANMNNSFLGKGYVTWVGTWRSVVPYKNFVINAEELLEQENGYIVKGTYSYEDLESTENVDTKKYSGDFEIKYSIFDNKEGMTSIVFN